MRELVWKRFADGLRHHAVGKLVRRIGLEHIRLRGVGVAWVARPAVERCPDRTTELLAKPFANGAFLWVHLPDDTTRVKF